MNSIAKKFKCLLPVQHDRLNDIAKRMKVVVEETKKMEKEIAALNGDSGWCIIHTSDGGKCDEDH